MLLDYATLPPEINSGRLHDGPGSAPLLAAAGAWRSVAAELRIAASSYRSVVTELAGSPWTGESAASMVHTVGPYATWLEQVAGEAEQTVARIDAAAVAYESARAVVVHPNSVAGNRTQRELLARTNVLGQNTPAIAVTEMVYGEMWAQDAVAMYGYDAASEGAARVPAFSPPPQQLAAMAGLGSPQGQSNGHGTAHPAAAMRRGQISAGALLQTSIMQGRMAIPIVMQVIRAVQLSGLVHPPARTVAGVGAGAARAASLKAGLGRLASVRSATAALGHAGTVGRLSVPMAWGMTNPVGGATLAGSVTPAHLMPVGAQQLGMLGHPHQHIGGPGKPTPRPDRTESARDVREAVAQLPSGGRVDFSRLPEQRVAQL